MGATPITVAVLLVVFILCVVKYYSVTLLEVPSVAVQPTGEDIYMGSNKVLSVVLDTFHGLGVSCCVSYLLPKVAMRVMLIFLVINFRLKKCFRYSSQCA